MEINEFINEAEKLGIKVSDENLKKLEIYYNELVSYNTHTNITGITNKKDVYLKHFYDSLTIIKAINLNEINNMIDIGTGAGFPGIVIKIFYPHINITLLDSNSKKVRFLEQIVSKLELENVKIICDRAENIMIDYLNQFDLCVSRAVAFIDIITSLSLPFIKENGKLVLMKGNFINEKIILDKHLNDLKIKKYLIINFQLPIINDERNLVIIEKKENTKEIVDYAKLIKRSKKWNT